MIPSAWNSDPSFVISYVSATQWRDRLGMSGDCA
ncbi:hypothetical protein PSEWESI4_02301 [Pseudomonas carbonaria]|uniref:Uncharacterized protein n=1 Tax=Zestomonas carbonaria TaxID=2762745 RepID=A0A7U7EMY8_9GAMM|nr:hypothetical protein PSEWESI4_02301 [Pseudomonas carbonaria]